MKSMIGVTVVVAALAGCTIVPAGSVLQACRVIEVAAAEADMAPAWYISAGQVLERCGVPDARERADASACAAQRRNGYDCEARP